MGLRFYGDSKPIHRATNCGDVQHIKKIVSMWGATVSFCQTKSMNLFTYYKPEINLLTAITSCVATLISASSKDHVTIEYHVMCLVSVCIVRYILYSTVKFYFHNFIFISYFF